MTTAPSLEEFVDRWWNEHRITLEHNELASNGQFDDIPYALYEQLYGELA